MKLSITDHSVSMYAKSSKKAVKNGGTWQTLLKVFFRYYMLPSVTFLVPLVLGDDYWLSGK